MNIGVLAIQGAVSEHIDALRRAFVANNVEGTAFALRTDDQLKTADGLIIPGGESTTITRVITKLGIFDDIVERVTAKDMAVMGTCAGAIMLAQEGGAEARKTGQKLLAIMNMAVERNAFGRQRESFQAPLAIDGFDEPFPAVFIRGPRITRVDPPCISLARFDDAIVMARQDNALALSFHPELTDDVRIHCYFLDMVEAMR